MISSSNAFFIQVTGFEVFGEPAVKWGEQLARLLRLALIAPDAHEPHGGAKFMNLSAPPTVSSIDFTVPFQTRSNQRMIAGFDCSFWRDGCPMDKNKHLVWDASDNVRPKGARPSAKSAAAPNDKLPVQLRWRILVALTVLSWILVGGIAIAVVAIVHYLNE